jgi:hypothetical protein
MKKIQTKYKIHFEKSKNITISIYYSVRHHGSSKYPYFIIFKTKVKGFQFNYNKILVLREKIMFSRARKNEGWEASLFCFGFIHK